MAIFRRDTPEPEPQRPALPSEVRAKPARPTRPPERAKSLQKATLVARGTRFEGIVRGDAEVLVEGEVVGEVNLEGDIEVGSHGRVQGDIKVRSARVSGQVEGNVLGREVIEVTPTGRLEGDVKAPRVIIREGAFFRGNIEMTGTKTSDAKGTPQKPGSPEARTPEVSGKGPAGSGGSGEQRAGKTSSSDPSGTGNASGKGPHSVSMKNKESGKRNG